MLPSIALALTFALAALPPGASADPSRVAARVNGVVIAAERAERWFEDYLQEKGRHVASIRSPAAYESLYREALEKLVEAELLWQEADRRKIHASKAEVDAAIAEVRASFKAPGAFERRLERSGFTEESYAEYLRRQLSIRKLVQRDVVRKASVSDAEVHAHYVENAARFTRPGKGEGEREQIPESEVRDRIREALLAEKAQAALDRKVQELRERGRVEIVSSRP